MGKDFKELDLSKYYRKDIYTHFTKDVRCSLSITNKIDVTSLVEYSKRTKTKFNVNFIYLLAKVLNSRDDYKTNYDYRNDKVVTYSKINPTHYVFNKEKELCTPVYTEYDPDYENFYQRCLADIEKAKIDTEYKIEERENYFDASYISWISYESLNIELPDGYLYFLPIINWGRYQEEKGKLLMPLTLRMNHAIADGYLVSLVYLLLEKEIEAFVLRR